MVAMDTFSFVAFARGGAKETAHRQPSRSRLFDCGDTFNAP